MLRVLLLGVALLRFAAAPSFADDGWSQASSSGFGSGSGVSEADRGTVFVDPADGLSYAYFGTKRPLGGGSIYRSSNGSTWNQVSLNGFGLGSNVPTVIWVSTFNNGTAYLFAGDTDTVDGARIYRSTGGPVLSNWNVVFDSHTTGNTNTTGFPGQPDSLYGNFYVGTENTSTGGEIWKSSSADNIVNWTRVAASGFGDSVANRKVSYLKTNGANIFAATNCPPASAPCGEIWYSTGTVNPRDVDTWTQIVTASTTFDTSNKTISISAMEAFQGYLYVTTMKTNGGAQVWRSNNPTNIAAAAWKQVYTPDGTCAQASGSCTDTTGAARFSVAASSEIHSLYNLAGVLYAATWDPSGQTGGGTIIYHSTDGVNWARSNSSAGFGSPNNQYIGGFATLGGQVYGPTLNATSGGAAWTAPLPTPSTPTVASIQQSSIAITYGSVGSVSGGFRVDAATAPGFTGTLISSITANNALLTLAPQNLNPDTTYYFRAGALWGSTTAFATIYPATSTLVVAPSTAPPGPLALTAITVNWSSNNNGPGTLYTVTATSNAFTTTITSATYNSFATFTGLPPSTTFNFTITARGNDGTTTAALTFGTTSTLLLPPGVPASPFTGISQGSVTVNWTVGATTLSVVQISTNNFTTVNFSSATGNLSVQFGGTGGAGANLVPNTSYYAQVLSSAAANVSSFTNLGVVMTIANPPTASAILSISSGSVLMAWQQNGNPSPGTSYEVWQSTDPAFGAGALFKTIVTTNSFTVGTLSPKTSYYFQARTLNASSSGGVTAFDTELSTFTSPAPSPTPTTPVGFAVGSTSISWTWSLTTDATSYNVFASTNSPSYNFLASTNAFSFTETGLFPNTTASVEVAGVDISGMGALSAPSAAAYTLAASPTNLSSPTVQATSVTLGWSLNGNPSITTAWVERSTDNANFGLIVSTVNTSWIDNGLLGCSTYYYRVRNTNQSGRFTPYSPSLQFLTTGSTPTAPTSMTGQSLPGNQIGLSWTPSSFEGITRYRLFYDAGMGVATINYNAAPLAVFTSTQTSYTTAVLTSSAAYTFALRATGRCGLEEQVGVFASAASVGTLPALRAAISAPTAGRHVSGNGVTVSASLIAGTIAQTAQVLFQYKASTSASWVNIPITAQNSAQNNPATASPYFIHWDVSNLTQTNYDLRAVATDVSGSSDTAAASVTVTVDTITPDITEGLSGGVFTKAQLINTTVVNTITAADLSTPLLTQLTLPANSLVNSTVTITLQSNPSLPAAQPVGANLSGLATSILIGDGETLVTGGIPASITFTYKDSQNTGVLDGTTVGIDQMKFFSYNLGLASWIQDIPFAVNTASRTITGFTPHFSFFAVFGVPATDLKSVRVYPNPWKPNGSNPDEGKPFAVGDTTSGILFDRLPASVTIKIYTITGQPVANIVSNIGTGKLQWDGRNDSGRDVASGLYLALISSPNLPTITRKILIVR